MSEKLDFSSEDLSSQWLTVYAVLNIMVSYLGNDIYLVYPGAARVLDTLFHNNPLYRVVKTTFIQLKLITT